jgi:hypothetical protein
MAVEPTKTTKTMLFVGHWIPLFVRKGLIYKLIYAFLSSGNQKPVDNSA